MRDADPAPRVIPRNPEAVPPLKAKHVRVLQNMLNHKLGMWAARPHAPRVDYLKAEIGALAAAIAALNELLGDQQ